MGSNNDEVENYRSPVPKAHVLGAVILSVSGGIAFDKIIAPGHVLFVSFSVLLTLLYVSIFRKVLDSFVMWGIVLAALAINIALAFVLPTEHSGGAPGVIFVPLVLVEFSVVYVAINWALKSVFKR